MSRMFVPLSAGTHFILGASDLRFGQLVLGIFASINAAQVAVNEFCVLRGIEKEIIWDAETYPDYRIIGYAGEVPDDQDKPDMFFINGIKVDMLNPDGWSWR